MKVLVAGATGYLSSHLVKELKKCLTLVKIEIHWRLFLL
ncbi:uncharacterized protein YbjT (DUF2867 family) [Amphibacillus cookii]|nr:uncharacterized protein YbjT (DUF2867 family) [Amphibacillus cookii]